MASRSKVSSSSARASRCSISVAGDSSGAIQRMSPSLTTDTTAATRGRQDIKQQQQQQQQQQQRPKIGCCYRCCFCWRCACRGTTNDSGCKSQSHDISLDNLSKAPRRLSLPEEIVRQWSESFEAVMASEKGREVFREFLRIEFSEENMLFWLAVEDLRAEQHKDIVAEKVRLIYEDFISILSPREVSLDARVKESITRGLESPTTQIFDEAQLQTYTLMKRDSYPRFLNSRTYRDLFPPATV